MPRWARMDDNLLDVENNSSITAAELTAINDTSSAELVELQHIDDATSISAAQLVSIEDISSTALVELQHMDDATSISAAQLTSIEDISSTTLVEIQHMDDATSISAAELISIDDTTSASLVELQHMDDATSIAASELVTLNGNTVFNTNLLQTVITVHSDAPVALPTTALTARKMLYAYNTHASGILYIGNSAVTAATGYKVAAGATEKFNLGPAVNLYGICATDGVDISVHVLEFS